MAIFGKKSVATVSDVAPKDDNKVSSEAAAENQEDKNSTAESELETLRAALETARREKQEAETRADKAEQQRAETSKRLTSETGNRINAEEVAITNALAAATSKAEQLERDIVDAQENGRFADAAKLTRQLANTQFEINKWTDNKDRFEAQKKQVDTQSDEVDPLSSFTPATRQWIKGHPQFLTDKVYKAKAMAAHHEAEAEGIAFDTPEYFSYIERKVEGNSQPNSSESDADDIQKPTGSQRSNRTATPPSRGASGGSVNKGNDNNRLSPEEVEMAIYAWPKLSAADAQKKYMESREALIKEGKIQRKVS